MKQITAHYDSDSTERQTADDELLTIDAPTDSDSDDGDLQDTIDVRRLPKLSNMSAYECIRYWALINLEKQSSLSMLLRILQMKCPELMLPTDARTLLDTPNTMVNVNVIEGGEYWHHGLRSGLETTFRWA